MGYDKTIDNLKAYRLHMFLSNCSHATVAPEKAFIFICFIMLSQFFCTNHDLVFIFHILYGLQSRPVAEQIPLWQMLHLAVSAKASSRIHMTKSRTRATETFTIYSLLYIIGKKVVPEYHNAPPAYIQEPRIHATPFCRKKS